MLDQDVLTNFRTSRLITLFLQSILYGIYIITSGSCARALTRVNGRWRSRRELQWPFLLAGAFLLVNTTYNVCIRLYNFLELFVFRGSDGLSIPSTFSRWNLIVEPTQLLCQSTVGDFVLIYRTFIVYRRNWTTITPSVILWLAAIACAGRALQLEATGATPNRFGPWFTAFWALSVSHNIITTLLLLYRLWYIDRSLPSISSFSSAPETQLHRIMRSIAESGMLYTATATIVLICGAANNYDVLLVASAVELVTVGIAFNLILIRANRSGGTQQEQESSHPQFTTIGPIVSTSSGTVSPSMIWTESKP